MLNLLAKKSYLPSGNWSCSMLLLTLPLKACRRPAI